MAGDKPMQFLQWLLNIFLENECINDMIIHTSEGMYLTTETPSKYALYFVFLWNLYLSVSKELIWNT